MRIYSWLFLLVYILICPFASAASNPTFSIYPASPRQGDVILFTIQSLSKPIKATLGGEPLDIFYHQGAYRAIAGIGATKPALVYNLRVYFEDESKIVAPIKISYKKFPRVILGVPEKMGVTASELVVNLSVNNKILAAATAPTGLGAQFKDGFALPLSDNRRITSVFGEVRITGSEEIRHLGIDLGASRGSFVAAVNSGIIKKVYWDDIYGNVVVMDHGIGITTLYMHLDKILVNEKQKIKKGDLIGLVGASGYAEYPHLHFSTKIKGISVDPLSLVRAFAI